MRGDRLRWARERAAMGQLDLAVALGFESQSMISMVERNERDLRLDHAAEAARVLGTSVDFLVGLSDDWRPCRVLAEGLGRAEAVEHELEDASGVGGGVSAGYVDILEVEAAAGGGVFIEGAPVRGYLPFRREWLREQRIDPGQCTVISVYGESMEPTLPNGSLVLVDHRRLTRRRGVISVLELGENLLVKRAGWSRERGWEMLSDNPYWPAIAWPEEAVIRGEVRWMSRGFS